MRDLLVYQSFKSTSDSLLSRGIGLVNLHIPHTWRKTVTMVLNYHDAPLPERMIEVNWAFVLTPGRVGCPLARWIVKRLGVVTG